MKRPSLAVCRYCHSNVSVLFESRAFNQGRKFFKTKTGSGGKRLRQIVVQCEDAISAMNALLAPQTIDNSKQCGFRTKSVAGSAAANHHAQICLDPKMPCRDTVFRWLRSERTCRLHREAVGVC